MLNPRQIILDRFEAHHPHIEPAFMYPNGSEPAASKARLPYVAREPKLVSGGPGPVKVRCGCGKLLRFSQQQDAFGQARAQAEVSKAEVERARARAVLDDPLAGKDEKDAAAKALSVRVPTASQVRKLDRKLASRGAARQMTRYRGQWVPTAALSPQQLEEAKADRGRASSAK